MSKIKSVFEWFGIFLYKWVYYIYKFVNLNFLFSIMVILLGISIYFTFTLELKEYQFTIDNIVSITEFNSDILIVDRDNEAILKSDIVSYSFENDTFTYHLNQTTPLWMMMMIVMVLSFTISIGVIIDKSDDYGSNNWNIRNIRKEYLYKICKVIGDKIVLNDSVIYTFVGDIDCSKQTLMYKIGNYIDGHYYLKYEADYKDSRDEIIKLLNKIK